MSHEWLVIGGGIHGLAVARALLEEGGVARDELCVIDAHARPAEAWRRRAAATGMRYLRSPSVHHIGGDPAELFRLAERSDLTGPPFRGRYHRPSLELFNAHLEHVAERTGIEAGWRCARARDLRRGGVGWLVSTETDVIESRRVVLAPGSGGEPNWPVWAHALREAGASIRHVFGPDGWTADAGRDVAVIGAGITGLHVARTCAEWGARRVTLVHARPLHVAEFDVEPGWLGPRRLPAFAACASADARHALIDRVRRRGSVPSRVLDLAAAEPAVGAWPATISHAEADAGGVVLTASDGTSRRVDRVVLATGYRSHPEGQRWWAPASSGLPVSSRGVPVPSSSLTWGPGLYVTGALAELELGPASRNVWGARTAARRISASA